MWAALPRQGRPRHRMRTRCNSGWEPCAVLNECAIDAEGGARYGRGACRSAAPNNAFLEQSLFKAARRAVCEQLAVEHRADQSSESNFCSTVFEPSMQSFLTTPPPLGPYNPSMALGAPSANSVPPSTSPTARRPCSPSAISAAASALTSASVKSPPSSSARCRVEPSKARACKPHHQVTTTTAPSVNHPHLSRTSHNCTCVVWYTPRQGQAWLQ